MPHHHLELFMSQLLVFHATKRCNAHLGAHGASYACPAVRQLQRRRLHNTPCPVRAGAAGRCRTVLLHLLLRETLSKTMHMSAGRPTNALCTSRPQPPHHHQPAGCCCTHSTYTTQHAQLTPHRTRGGCGTPAAAPQPHNCGAARHTSALGPPQQPASPPNISIDQAARPRAAAPPR